MSKQMSCRLGKKHPTRNLYQDPLSGWFMDTTVTPRITSEKELSMETPLVSPSLCLHPLSFRLRLRAPRSTTNSSGGRRSSGGWARRRPRRRAWRIAARCTSQSLGCFHRGRRSPVGVTPTPRGRATRSVPRWSRFGVLGSWFWEGRGS